ncbi:hypothetical protein RhiirC2_792865 [Rhizophagus irregularis]|uniref:Uncharacterized protein n=1 Tax=Rhizophagus irregularis TaxID=588596 RepID=A0A2N1MGH9_9GLOM|nr:hypothetical protein RhiirC2_792865 [Rhizophagus irregularis]
MDYINVFSLDLDVENNDFVEDEDVDRYSVFSLLLCMNLDRAYLSELNGDDEGWQLAVFMKFSRDHGHPILEFFSQYNIQLSNNSSSLSTSLLQNINNIDSNSLTWENPLANGIISDNDTSILNNDKLCKQFNKPINNMIVNKVACLNLFKIL